MTIRECRDKAVFMLHEKYRDIKLSTLEADILLMFSLNITKIDIINNADSLVLESDINYFLKLIERRLDNEPIAYITGLKEFYGRDFYVDSSVLIPRPETEELIDIALQYIKKACNVIDIGTGSGAIAITIKAIIKDVEMSAMDISKSALDIAKKNATNILTDSTINFIEANAIDYTPNIKYDVILSNPPYVALRDKKLLSADLSYEPSTALFAGDDGLNFYNNFIPVIGRYLKRGGVFIFEIGYDQADSLLDICRENNIDNVIVKKDLSNNDRFLICKNY